jgi:spermidine synthase
MLQSSMSERNIQRLLLLAFCLSGAAALIYEVVWTRALSFVLGSTVYSLSILLATFMAGLALGAYAGGKVADRGGNLLLYFALFELGIGLFGLVTVPLIYGMPLLYWKMHQALHMSARVYFVSVFALSSAIMLVPTTLMGATFPVVSRRITKGMEEMGRKVGDAYSMNTLGAIGGSLLAGFVLVPALGIKWASFTGAILNLSVGLSILLLSGARRFGGYAVLALAVAGAGGLAVSEAAVKHPYLTFYQAGKFEDEDSLREAERTIEILFSKDYAEGRVLAYREKGMLTVQEGGKTEGTGVEEVPNTTLLAALPAAHRPERAGDMLLIGLGSGVTAFAGKHLADTLEAVEINPGVVEVVERFGLPGVLEGVKVHVTDGRRYLTYTDRKFDIIVSGTSVPSEAMSANLFTRQYYEIVASRLGEGGLFSQHLPVWALTKRDARICFKTFASVFRHARVWFVPASEDFIMVGSVEPFRYPPDVAAGKAVDMSLSVLPGEWTGGMSGDDPDVRERFRVELIRDEDRMREALALDLPVINDDTPFLEFSVTRNLLLGPGFAKIRP